MDPRLAAHLDRHGVVTTRTAQEWTTAAWLRAAVRRGELVSVWRGALARGDAAGLLTTRLLGLAALAGHPVTACGPTAAELLGFAVDPDPAVHVLAPPTHALGRRPGLVLHQRTGAPVGGSGALRLTAPAWTAVEVARTQRPGRALATLDAALRTGRCDGPALRAALDAQVGRRGTVVVARLLPWADGLAESPMESETRHVLLDAGLPRPVLQHPVRVAGREVHRLDLAWPRARVAVEYDGVEFHSSARALRRDRARTASLLEQGWTVLPVTSDDVRHGAHRLVHRVATLLERGDHGVAVVPAPLRATATP